MTVGSRRAAIEWAQRIVADPSVVFLDLETTGKAKDSHIVDVGIVDLSGAVLMDQLVRPDVSIPDEAAAVHGITNELVIDAPDWVLLASDVRALIDERTVCIFNADYDTAVLTNNLARAGITYAVPGECAMLAFAQFMGVPGFKGQWKWHRLDVAAAHFGIKPGGHRALADAEATRQVVLAMARSGVSPPELSIREQAVQVADGVWQQAFGRPPRLER
jgi:DNA polymerase III epsilon subunit-like protein